MCFPVNRVASNQRDFSKSDGIFGSVFIWRSVFACDAVECASAREKVPWRTARLRGCHRSARRNKGACFWTSDVKRGTLGNLRETGHLRNCFGPGWLKNMKAIRWPTSRPPVSSNFYEGMRVAPGLTLPRKPTDLISSLPLFTFLILADSKLFRRPKHDRKQLVNIPSANMGLKGPGCLKRLFELGSASRDANVPETGLQDFLQNHYVFFAFFTLAGSWCSMLTELSTWRRRFRVRLLMWAVGSGHLVGGHLGPS